MGNDSLKARSADIASSHAPYHGLSGLLSGLLVAFTQIIPEHQIQLFGVLKARVKVRKWDMTFPLTVQTIPGLYLLVSNVLVIVLGPSPFILIQFGFFVAWIYLRFLKLSENGEYRGDRSETFAFQYWFPPIIRFVTNLLNGPIVTNVCSITGRMLLCSRIMSSKWPSSCA